MIEVGSPEWHEIRRTLVTASDLPVIMGKSPWSTPLKLYHQKKFGIKLPSNPAMERGIALEPVAREKFEQWYGDKFPPKFEISTKYPWLAASFDGINDKTSLEIKCPGRADHEMAISGVVPDKYRHQLIGQMLVSEFEDCFYMSYHPEHEQPIIIIKFYLDHEEAKRTLHESQKFFDLLISNTPPDPISGESVIRLDSDWRSVEEELHILLARTKADAKRAKELKERLVVMANGTPTIGRYLKLTQVRVSGTVDYSAIPELINVNLDDYRKPGSVTWRIDEV